MIAQATFDAFGDMPDMLGLFAPPGVEWPQDMGSDPASLSPPAKPPMPEASCIVGVIDHAIPFAHRLLTTDTGHSRVAAIWLMDAPRVQPAKHIAFGQQLLGTQIDYLRGLDGGPVKRDAEALYRWLGLINPARPEGRRFLHQYSHGASVAGVAAGFDPGDKRGLAHPLIGVSLPDWSLADTSGAWMPMLLQAGVSFIIAQARILSALLTQAIGRQVHMPLVVNISLGVTAGPRDGSSLVERMQDALCADPPPGLGPIHFILATGNTRQERLNAVLTPGKSERGKNDRIGWQLMPDDRTLSALEIWSAPHPPGQDAMRVRLTLPGGRSVTSDFKPPQPGHGQIAYIRDPDNGFELARMVLQGWGEHGDATMRQVLTVIAPPSVTALTDVTTAAVGEWQLQLLSSPAGACKLVVQRDDRLPGFPPSGRQSCLVDPAYQARLPDGQWPGPDPDPPTATIRRNGTCNAYAWGSRQTRCGAAFGPPHQIPPNLSSYSALLADGTGGDVVSTGDRGPNRPGILAPGMTHAAMNLVSGTSIAAPRATRWLAEHLAAGTLPALARNGEGAPDHRNDHNRWPGPFRVDPVMPWDIRE